MPHVVRSTIIDAPVDVLWSVLRDFNGHESWHPIVARSAIERSQPSDRIGCVRRFTLQDGSELREQLLTLSDLEMTFSYCLLDTPIPLFNYVAHVRLLPVTDGNRSFWHWESRFTTPPGREAELAATVGDEVYTNGIEAVRQLPCLRPGRAERCRSTSERARRWRGGEPDLGRSHRKAVRGRNAADA
jgi:hypothetical protein